MKKILPIIILLFSLDVSQAQENNPFIDSILNLVIKNEISVFNESFFKIKNGVINATKTDTVVNCLWTRPKFIDNIFNPSFDGVLVTYPIIYDTSTNKINNNYLDFKTIQHDDYGNYKFEKTVFLIHKKEKKKNIVYNFHQQFPELKNTIWQNEKIQYGKMNFHLDSCHVIFRLAFHDDFSFAQYFEGDPKNCNTKEMDSEIETGVESENFYDYAYKLQGHFIENPNGFWKTENNILQFLNKNKRNINSFKILSITEKELELKLIDSDYIIKMKRVIQ